MHSLVGCECCGGKGCMWACSDDVSSLDGVMRKGTRVRVTRNDAFLCDV